MYFLQDGKGIFFPGALWLLQVDIRRLLHQAKCPKGNSSGQVSGIFRIISQPILLLIEEIPVKTIWDLKNPVNNGMNYLSTGAGFFPSTVWELCARSSYFGVVVHVFSPGLFFFCTDARLTAKHTYKVHGDHDNYSSTYQLWNRCICIVEKIS